MAAMRAPNEEHSAEAEAFRERHSLLKKLRSQWVGGRMSANLVTALHDRSVSESEIDEMFRAEFSAHADRLDL